MADLPNKSVGLKFPEFDTVAKRLETFANWSRDCHLQPRELAEAGLFYQGDGNSVTCFYCGAVLSQWAYGDEAWTEHERFSPTCEHVLLHKMGGLSLGDVNEHVQGHPVQASGDESHTILQCSVASHQALQSREDSVQEEQDVLKERDHETVEEEIQRLRRQFLCKTCLKEKACIVFIPCGHLSACPACAEEVLNCNVCQQDIKATVKAYCA